ncbi:hypothetical protein J2X31_003603 [Flavobacterium arsenatis]|uniref:AB hydrolase-1 domain-containing protein n=1 Tax=Flavobacterium arsenatis TaxID=1484332 RepID=A0ABU1TUM1_9FLAO|nr:hypothetical protein [Flavobacterium arsenatis]MDR6969570.1 hypothetical protein [Flavobacterium arsenatis]
MKKLILITLGLLTLWFLFIWIRYDFFYSNLTQDEIDKVFTYEKMKTPEFDSINLRGYSIKYLTNKKNRDTEYDQNNKRKPYLVLLHSSGKNATYFLDYFRNKEIQDKFHIIAIDRLGFGKTTFNKPEDRDYIFEQEKEEFGNMADYVSGSMVHHILENEGHHLEEVRIVSEGNSGIIGLEAYRFEYLSFSKVFLFNSSLQKRFLISKIFSKMITSNLVSPLFPRAFVSKHQDLLLLDKSKETGFDWLINFGKDVENDENKDRGYMYHSKGKMFKSIFFIGINSNGEKRVKSISGDSNFIFESKGFNIYKNPDKTLKSIIDADAYTLDFNRIYNQQSSDFTN